MFVNSTNSRKLRELVYGKKERLSEPFPFAVYKIDEVCYNFGIFVNNENAKKHS